MDEWTIVKNKNKRNKGTKPKTVKTKLSREAVINKLRTLTEYDPIGIFLFGSVARNTHTHASDVDVLMIWKKNIPNDIEEIKDDLMKTFGTNVDLICMIMESKMQNFVSSQNFIDNVRCEGIAIMGDLNDVCISRLVGKI